MTTATHEVSPFLRKFTEEICLRDTFRHKICQHWKDLTTHFQVFVSTRFQKAKRVSESITFLMYMKKHGMKKNRGGGGVLNLTSTTTVAMNKVVDEITVRSLEFTEVDDLKDRVRYLEITKQIDKRANNSDDLPLFYTDQSVGFHRGHRNTPIVSVTLAELLTNQEEVNPLPCCGSSDGDDMEMNTKMLLNGISCEAKEGEMNGLSWSKRFSAEFRLPSSLSKKKQQARAQPLIDQLGLRNAATTVIGDEGHRGVSGGERRRVSIGIDIIHDPIVLFLDEPTSGLDSTSAYMVVKVLQRIAKSGNKVYSGSPTDLPRFFSEYGHIIPENENKTEFALDLIREPEDSPEGTKSALFF
ncbi:hypothetical protein DY000_02063143 [Brassica cretica]|uniref:ABC transporter domain-containing protein n=1 Tax=Brassica cretica TaxID=69181 RepID=A0ABQ7B1J5_BRACR|nr:hypothetical protein DY000_02063143 [Brassica cretica]